MTEEIIIDVSNCPRKRDDDCMEVPICNEYGDLMGYQSCEAQTLCPYRSQKKIERLEQERDELKRACNKCKLFDIEKTNRDLLKQVDELKQENKDLKKQRESDKGLITVGGKQQYEYLQKINELEQENKELKNIIKIHDSTKYDYYKLMKENEEWHIKYAGCNTANSAIQEENKQYRSALEEIREIAERELYLKQNSSLIKIIDRINEVLNLS